MYHDDTDSEFPKLRSQSMDGMHRDTGFALGVIAETRVCSPRSERIKVQFRGTIVCTRADVYNHGFGCLFEQRNEELGKTSVAEEVLSGASVV
jgi:hypothetical protein